jgi:hypothetical protein
VERALIRDDGELEPMRRRARERTMDEHTLERRAAQLVSYLDHPLQSTTNHAVGGA